MQIPEIAIEPMLTLSLIRRIQRLLLIFISGLLLSGLTAFPLETELQMVHKFVAFYFEGSVLDNWIRKIYQGVQSTNEQYPFISYGTDWLGFAHLVIAVAFIGPLKDPVKNIWVIQFGLIACVSIVPFAFIAGSIRDIPVFWRLLDCMFGVAGGLILLFCYRDISKLQKITRIS